MSEKARRPAKAVAAALSPARRRTILAARAAQLSARRDVVSHSPRERVLVCAVGLSLYGIDLDQVAKVRPFDHRGAAPVQSPAALGLIVDNGQIRLAMDLGVLLGQGGASPSTGWLILLAPPLKTALRVDELPVSAEVEPLEGDADRARILGGEHADKVLVRLSAAELIASHAKPLQGAHVQ